MHKFHLGQTVGYRPAGGSGRVRDDGPTAGVFEYRIRSADEQHERMVRESELKAVTENEAAPGGAKGKR